jgi:hypothetical protein
MGQAPWKYLKKMFAADYYHRGINNRTPVSEIGIKGRSASFIAI